MFRHIKIKTNTYFILRTKKICLRVGASHKAKKFNTRISKLIKIMFKNKVRYIK